MQLTNKINGLALATIFAGALVSCTNDLNEPVVNKPDALPALKLVKAPDVTAWSGEQILGNTFAVKATRGEGGPVVASNTIKGTFKETDVKDLSDKVNERLSEGKTNVDQIDTDFLYYAEEDLTFNLYCLLKNTNQIHYLGLFYYDEDGEKHEQKIWESIEPNFYDKSYDWDYENDVQVVTQNLEGVQVTVKAGYKFGFYWDGVCRPHEGNYTDETCVYYSISDLNEPQKDSDSDEVLSTHAGTFDVDGKTILGLEDWYDFDYQDLVFFTDVTLKKVESSEKFPTIEEDVKCPSCGHPESDCEKEGGCGHKDCQCPNCKQEPGDKSSDEGGDNNGNEEETEEPDVETSVTNPTGQNEVEINLSFDEKPTGEAGVSDLVSKLSIHVRHATDVEVFIPVPKLYYVEADDMAIVMQHEPNHMLHGGPYEVKYNLKDSELTVTLTVAFEDDGIRITTDGITQEVIDWCYEKCGDGINFEIWNYFNDTLTEDKLEEYLNQATVKFLDKEPDYYINAFNENEDGSKFENDCTVEIVDDQKADFNYNGEGEHLNGSSKNQIYENKNPKSQEE